MNVEIIEPYGFCVGVKRAISTIERILKENPNEKIYCLGRLVHNQEVIDNLAKKGIIFLDGDKEKLIDSLEKGIVVFSAHGTSKKILKKAKNKRLKIVDAVCPFVSKEFEIIENKLQDDYQIIYIGTNNHEEAKAALSLSNNIHFVTSIDDVNKLEINDQKIAVINQTTLSIINLKSIYQAIQEKYKNVVIIDEICNSTRIRQEKLISKSIIADGIIIVGDKTSNNSISLYNIALHNGYDAIMVSKYQEIDLTWLNKKENIAILSGASTPNETVNGIYKKLLSI